MPRPKKSSYSEDKPPYSYVALCAMAIHSSPLKMMTLSEIYNFIIESFPFYKRNGTRWQNSLRHNLSYNDCFVKVAKNCEERKKGNYWTLHADASKMFENGSFLRRKKRFSSENTIKQNITCIDRVKRHSGMPCQPYFTKQVLTYKPIESKSPTRLKSFNIEDILELPPSKPENYFKGEDYYCSCRLCAIPNLPTHVFLVDRIS